MYNFIMNEPLEGAGLYVHKTIEGCEAENKPGQEYVSFTPQDKTVKRIKELGLEGKLHTDVKLPSFEKAMWDFASRLKEKIFSYKKIDYINSLKFIELFCFFAAESGFHKMRDNDILMDIPRDKTVLKAVKLIEEINETLESSEKIDKDLMKPKLKRLNLLVDKIFINDLGITAQKGVIKEIKKAESILKKMVA